MGKSEKSKKSKKPKTPAVQPSIQSINKKTTIKHTDKPIIVSTSKPQAAVFTAKTVRDHISLVSTQQEHLIYESAPIHHHQYAIGIYDKATKTLQIQNSQLVDILPVFTEDDEDDVVKLVGQNNNMEARNSLGEAFGSKKKIQQIRSLAANRVTSSTTSDVSASLLNTIKSSAIEIQVGESNGILPLHDLNATEVDQAYDMESIAPAGEWKGCMAKQFLGCKDRAVFVGLVDAIFPSIHVKNSLWTLLSSNQTKPPLNIIKKYIYLLQSMKFYSLDSHRVSFLAKKSDETEYGPLLSIFLSRFCEGNDESGYKKSDQMKDKHLIYILLLALSLNGWKLSLKDLARDLCISGKKMKVMAREVGCKAVDEDVDMNGAKHANVQLVVPLTFPKRTR